MSPDRLCIRREVWRARPWMAVAANVVEDYSELLVLHVPVGAPFGFVDDHPLGRHPWRKAHSWGGQDVVMVQRPGEAYSVWFFGETVYINLQDPMRRFTGGFDTFDHELDVVVEPEGAWAFKDDDKLDRSIESGRFDSAEISAIRAQGALIGELLETGDRWWTGSGADYRRWTAPRSFTIPTLPEGWALM